MTNAMTTTTERPAVRPTRDGARVPVSRMSRRPDQELFVRWQHEHDRAARDQLVARYLPLARGLARRYNAQESFDDLLQVASLGLVKAIDRFDPERGLAFTSFAVPTILGELKRYFRDYGWATHVPRGAKERALKLQHLVTHLTGQLGRTPTINELAQYSETSVERVLDALDANAGHHTASFEEPIHIGDDTTTIADSVGAPDPRFELIETTTSIAAAASQFSDIERRVLTLRFVYDLTQREIAERIGVSQMQVSRVLSRVVAHLNGALQTDSATADEQGD